MAPRQHTPRVRGFSFPCLRSSDTTRLHRSDTMNLRHHCLAVTLAALSAASTHAAITLHDSQATFQAALTTPVTTIDFNWMGSLVDLPSTSTYSGVSFSSVYLTSGDISWHMASYPGYTDPWLKSWLGLTITPPSYTTSAAFEMGAYFGNPTTVTATAYTNLGHSLSATNASATTMSFCGFVTSADEYITSITVTQTSDRNYEAIDDFTFGTVAIPEPATTGAIIGALGLVACFARRLHPTSRTKDRVS